MNLTYLYLAETRIADLRRDAECRRLRRLVDRAVPEVGSVADRRERGLLTPARARHAGSR
jgi:hypothetical protein